MKLKDKDVALRLLNDCENDYKLLEKWYKEDYVYKNFEQRILNYEEIKSKYSKRLKEDSKIPVLMIEVNDEPVGIIQYQIVSYDNLKLYNIDYENVYEIDIFIGEKNMHNKGIGAKTIKLLINYLIQYKDAEYLIMCPRKDNYNAIRCYKKCDFIEKSIFVTNDTIGNKNEYLLMMKEVKK